MKIGTSSSDYEKIEWIKDIFSCVKTVKSRRTFSSWTDEKLLELFEEIDGRDLLPEPTTEYIEREYKTPELIRSYQRAYHERKKQYKEKAKQEERFELRKARALGRAVGMCWKCSKIVPLINQSVEIYKKPNRVKRCMKLHANCRICDAKLKLWAGYYDD